MSRPLRLAEVVELQRQQLLSYGGLEGIRNNEALKSAIAQPFQTWDGKDLYPSIEEKAAVYCFLISQNQPFIDGNKRTAFSAMDIFLRLNGVLLSCDEEEGVEMMISLAEGRLTRQGLLDWIVEHTLPMP